MAVAIKSEEEERIEMCFGLLKTGAVLRKAQHQHIDGKFRLREVFVLEWRGSFLFSESILIRDCTEYSKRRRRFCKTAIGILIVATAVWQVPVVC
jgi:hypothetical protein